MTVCFSSAVAEPVCETPAVAPPDVPEDPPGLLMWLQGWYTAHCDGDWEHDEGIRIGTLDNPGWSLRIRLTDTAWETKPFERVKVERDEHDWVNAWVDGGA